MNFDFEIQRACLQKKYFFLLLSCSMEIESEKNPLLQHFYVYLQVLLSQALEPGFLEEVFKKKGMVNFQPK